MRIIEVRDGFIKFEADKNTCLSSFVQIQGLEKCYVAQVLQIKRAAGIAVAYAKILFLFDGSGLQSYDKTMPSKDAEIKEFTFDILKNSIKVCNPIIAGKTLGQDINITVDESAFDRKMLISVDDANQNNLLIRNFAKQFEHLGRKFVVIDTLGVVKARKFVAGVDFKLPLDTDSLNFMYEDCLNDATADSKSLIVEIFKDLAEYSKTVPFVPFEALKSIVDEMVDKSHVFKLLVLKNKLAKFDRLGYFAKSEAEVAAINKVLNSKCVIIDLSKLDAAFQNRYLTYIYEKLNELDNTQVFLELSNVINKKNIQNVLLNDNVPTTIVTHSRFKYLNDIKNVFDNFIVTPSMANNSIFDIFTTFLSAMERNTFLLAGEAVNYIPLVSKLQPIDEVEDLDSGLEDLPVKEVTEGDEVKEVASQEETEISTEEPISMEIKVPEVEVSEAAPKNIFSDEPEEVQTEEEPDSLVEDVSEEDLEFTPQEEEEIPLTEAFETEVHPSVVIEDYVPQEQPEAVELIQDEQVEDSLMEEISEEEIIPQDEPEELAPIEQEGLTEFEDEDVESIEEISDVPVEEPEILEDAETIDDSETIEISDDLDLDLSEGIEELPEQDDMELPQEPVEEQPIEDEPAQMDVIPVSADDNADFEEIVELNPDEIDDNDIVVDMAEEEPLADNLDEQIVKDVDKVFTTRKEDNISDSDLDFIDELNSEPEEELEEYSGNSELEELAEADDGILEELPQEAPLEEINEEQEILETKNSSTPIVPVYDADIPQEDMVMSDEIQQGDSVYHTKYGNGVVEKMIKYGNKTLFSINFDNIGRRLLDPTLTEIKKS